MYLERGIERDFPAIFASFFFALEFRLHFSAEHLARDDMVCLPDWWLQS